MQYAHSKGMPVFIMEPLSGGKLVSNLPPEAKKLFGEYKKKYTPAEWSFRWLWNQKEVTVVLSGMNSEKMIEENIKTASTVKIGEMEQEDEAMLKKVVDSLNSKMKVKCTGCGYCVPCPAKVDIPGVFAAYNRRFSEGWFRSLKDYFMCTTLRKDSTSASSCIGCGKCESHCPQQIKIRENLKEVQKEMEGPIYKIARKVAKIITKF